MSMEELQSQDRLNRGKQHAALEELLEATTESEIAEELEAGCDQGGPAMTAFFVLGHSFQDAAQQVWGDAPNPANGYGRVEHDPNRPIESALKYLVDEICETEHAAELEAGEAMRGPVFTACQALGMPFEAAAEKIYGENARDRMAEEDGVDPEQIGYTQPGPV